MCHIQDSKLMNIAHARVELLSLASCFKREEKDLHSSTAAHEDCDSPSHIAYLAPAKLAQANPIRSR